MKKIFTHLAVMLSLTAILPTISVSAQGPFKGTFVLNGVEYYGAGTSASITGYTADVGAIVSIPATVSYNGHVFNLSSIAANAFANCQKLQEIIFETTHGSGMPLKIGDKAFDTPSLRRIVTYRGILPVVSGDPFSPTTYESGELVVSDQLTPDQQNAYKTTKPWSTFFENDHGVVTGITSPEADGKLQFRVSGGILEVTGGAGDAEMTIYNLLGTPVYQGPGRRVSLPSGVYLIKAQGRTSKIRI